MYRTSREVDRLASLAADIRRAGDFSVVEVGGQQMVRVEMPDGGRRMSAVSDEELEQLRETLDDNL